MSSCLDGIEDVVRERQNILSVVAQEHTFSDPHTFAILKLFISPPPTEMLSNRERGVAQ